MPMASHYHGGKYHQNGPSITHLQKLLVLLRVGVHVAQDLDRHILPAVHAAEEVAKRAARNLFVEDDVAGFQLPVVRRAPRCRGRRLRERAGGRQGFSVGLWLAPPETQSESSYLPLGAGYSGRHALREVNYVPAASPH